jgi:ABC-type multidrug transport system ATPase subunit
VLEPFVTIDRLTKAYGRLTVLHDVSFDIRAGEVLGLIGPNGAGKTTLFECIAGVLPADRGGIAVRGRAATPGVPDPAIFYMPDGIAPWPAQPVHWVLDYAAGFFGAADGECDRVVKRLKLERLLASRVGELSKGERKRVLLAVAMLTPHPLLLADEPFDGLDLRQTAEIGAALREHAGSGRTLFLSIHQITDAARVCDRFVLLSSGRVRGIGTLTELTARLPEAVQASTPAAILEEVVLALT